MVAFVVLWLQVYVTGKLAILSISHPSSVILAYTFIVDLARSKPARARPRASRCGEPCLRLRLQAALDGHRTHQGAQPKDWDQLR